MAKKISQSVYIIVYIKFEIHICSIKVIRIEKLNTFLL